MSSSNSWIQNKSPSLLIFAFVLFHFLVWISLPALLENSIRLDVAEGVINGPAWELSYERHPPFSSWLTGTIWQFGQIRYLALYGLGQTLALSALTAILLWLKQTLGSKATITATLCFLISPFATYLPIQVNHNYGVISFWAFTYVTAWYALEKNRWLDWLALGLAIGLGLWAKYSVLHLVIPLICVGIANPIWRARLLSLKLIIGAFVTTVIITPHILDVVAKGASTIKFATRTEPASLLSRLEFSIGFAINTALYQIPMALIFIGLFGAVELKQSVKRYAHQIPTSRLDLFIVTAAFGPIFIILFAAFFGVQPKLLWLTPISISFIVVWARLATLIDTEIDLRRSVWVFAVGAIFFIGAYSASRFIIPATSSRAAYADMDGPALARLAQDYWQKHAKGPIPYIVSFGSQSGRQAIGSIVFDLPYPVQALEENDPEHSPWIDMKDLRKRGALVVAPRNLPDDARVAGRPIIDIVKMTRPMAGPTQAKPEITFGFVAPSE